MPHVRLKEADIYYTLDGPVHGPALVLSNSLGTTSSVWAQQIPCFSQSFRVLRYDTRGHGLSGTSPEPFDFFDLAGDVVGLLNHLEIAKAHFCGISMGGLVGLAMALRDPTRVDRLVLSNTAARIGSAEGWRSRAESVAHSGLEALSSNLIERWLSPAYRHQEPGMTQVLVDMLSRTDQAGYIACCSVLGDADFGDQLPHIQAKALVISGTEDLATTSQQGRDLAAGLLGGQFLEIDAAHIANWERPHQFSQIVSGYLLGHRNEAYCLD